MIRYGNQDASNSLKKEIEINTNANWNFKGKKLYAEKSADADAARRAFLSRQQLQTAPL
jgi:hypothetical protein